MAQQLPLGAGGFDNLGGGDLTARTLQIIALVTVLGLAPGLLMMVTCFPFLVTVLAILRQAIGLQQSPPNMLIVSLALFLTWFVMDPVLTEAWQTGLRPVIDEEMSLQEGATAALRPLRGFMAGRIDPATFAALAELRLPPEAGPALAPTPVAPAALAPAQAPALLPDPGTAPLSLLVPSFMLSEIRRAFEIGFLIYLPFLIIDLVVSAVLMSMGMMMVPPSVVSMPFKLAFFVVADGWALLSAALVRSYV
ncbi:flagellar type III secretion system pore protein FliP [Frigidibacter oleivorans]|uniref:flagellar type III secretion system pore protein FliP n=1 Tax=Frigidibacter oleivorans TaxID=2487129 RepID=UPI000F8D881B|nr:flagellar type III secretion system pore protein FliP [Frigidibacter oleivorans]